MRKNSEAEEALGRIWDALEHSKRTNPKRAQDLVTVHRALRGEMSRERVEMLSEIRQLVARP